MKKLIVFDCEVYPNYTLVAFKNIDNEKVLTFEIIGEDNVMSEEDIFKFKNVMVRYTTFGFNSRNYDIPVMLYILSGKTAGEVFKLSNFIINNNSQGWQTLQKIGLKVPRDFDTFDIQEPAPGVRVSLKLYGGRMHSKKLQDLPIEPGTYLNDDQIEDMKTYCVNDLDTTIELYREIEDGIQLRVDMGKKYGQDLRSKSDAQIAEVVIKSEIQRMGTTKYLRAPKISPTKTFKYEAPEYIKFKHPDLKKALAIIESHDFEIDGRGSIKLPDELRKMKLKIGYSTYQLGIGGLHSKEKKQAVIPNENQVLKDKDVAAYYPSIILNLKLFPKHLGPIFLDIYNGIVQDRLHAKANKITIVDKSLKIVINGSFGKLGSKYSALYSPDLMKDVTLTGQLSLLVLIERLEAEGISVVSANTDGFVSLIPKELEELYENICFDWELQTNFELETAEYKALYSRDVNNYIAVKDDNFKGKGIFTFDAITKNPQGDISAIAVKEFLCNDIPIEQTIRECEDISKFIVVRSVAGGGVWETLDQSYSEYLGKVVRWIYVEGGNTIHYKKNGNKVPKSDGCEPIMNLGKGIPKNIDYGRYIEEAYSIAESLGLNLDL